MSIRYPSEGSTLPQVLIAPQKESYAHDVGFKLFVKGHGLSCADSLIVLEIIEVFLLSSVLSSVGPELLGLAFLFGMHYATTICNSFFQPRSTLGICSSSGSTLKTVVYASTSSAVKCSHRRVCSCRKGKCREGDCMLSPIVIEDKRHFTISAFRNFSIPIKF